MKKFKEKTFFFFSQDFLALNDAFEAIGTFTKSRYCSLTVLIGMDLKNNTVSRDIGVFSLDLNELENKVSAIRAIPVHFCFYFPFLHFNTPSNSTLSLSLSPVSWRLYSSLSFECLQIIKGVCNEEWEREREGGWMNSSTPSFTGRRSRGESRRHFLHQIPEIKVTLLSFSDYKSLNFIDRSKSRSSGRE